MKNQITKILLIFCLYAIDASAAVDEANTSYNKIVDFVHLLNINSQGIHFAMYPPYYPPIEHLKRPPTVKELKVGAFTVFMALNRVLVLSSMHTAEQDGYTCFAAGAIALQTLTILHSMFENGKTIQPEDLFKLGTEHFEKELKELRRLYSSHVKTYSHFVPTLAIFRKAQRTDKTLSDPELLRSAIFKHFCAADHHMRRQANTYGIEVSGITFEEYLAQKKQKQKDLTGLHTGLKYLSSSQAIPLDTYGQDIQSKTEKITEWEE